MEPFVRAQKYVAEYFQQEVTDPTRGLRMVNGERYILVRAASISSEFPEVIKSMYPALEPEEARLTASNILFELAHAIGKADAGAFHRKMKLVDPIEKLSAGPIHFAHSGWAFVVIFPESRAVPNSEFYLIYEHPQSFEADAWIAEDRTSAHPVCFMNSGYSSGWCEESFGLPLAAREILCRARGDGACRFIMAPPELLGDHVTAYREKHPDLFQEK
ncbi:MAG TPA: V4R domain-containing protein [Acidobacteriota bacterium]|nr:V4R domain-containing protein [Acidobacteriota bacterium]